GEGDWSTGCPPSSRCPWRPDASLGRAIPCVTCRRAGLHTGSCPGYIRSDSPPYAVFRDGVRAMPLGTAVRRSLRWEGSVARLRAVSSTAIGAEALARLLQLFGRDT